MTNQEHPIMKFGIGNFVVIKGFSVGEIVCYIDDNYPFEDIKKLMDNGTIFYRTPSEIEKEYCFWFYNQISKNEGAKLSGLKEWELKFRNK